jgi:hypothetical protein
MAQVEVKRVLVTGASGFILILSPSRDRSYAGFCLLSSFSGIPSRIPPDAFRESGADYHQTGTIGVARPFMRVST